jgi:hypothetical protein
LCKNERTNLHSYGPVMRLQHWDGGTWQSISGYSPKWHLWSNLERERIFSVFSVVLLDSKVRKEIIVNGKSRLYPLRCSVSGYEFTRATGAFPYPPLPGAPEPRFRPIERRQVGAVFCPAGSTAQPAVAESPLSVESHNRSPVVAACRWLRTHHSSRLPAGTVNKATCGNYQ